MQASWPKKSDYSFSVSSTGRSRVTIHSVGSLRRGARNGPAPEQLSIPAVQAVEIAFTTIIGTSRQKDLVAPVDRRGLPLALQWNLPRH